VLVFDAAGLALFAVTGAHKALAFGLDPVMAALLGMLTGSGGSMARDVLLAEIPTVLRAEQYAVAALAGAAVVVEGDLIRVPSPWRWSRARPSASGSASLRSVAAGTSRSSANRSSPARDRTPRRSDGTSMRGGCKTGSAPQPTF
jgi:hypothetical protein